MTKRERDDETGEFVDKYPPRQLLTAIQDRGGRAATSEIADQLDANRNSIYKKLQTMEQEGEVSSDMAGGIRIWSIREG